MAKNIKDNVTFEVFIGRARLFYIQRAVAIAAFRLGRPELRQSVAFFS